MYLVYLLISYNTLILFMFQSKLNIYCLSGVSGAIHIAGIAWYNGLNGYLEPNCPSLAICFESGRCQIMKNDLDESRL